jgi:hypothetical protein
MLEEVDIVSSFDLVTPTYKAAHARILEMDGVFQEREYLTREIEVTTNLLRSEEEDELSVAIASHTKSSDNLTALVVLFSSLSGMLVANVLVDFSTQEETGTFWKMAWIDGGIFALGLIAWVAFLWRRQRTR